MADPLLTDVFKFLAVRPAQLALDSQTQVTFIRDARAATLDGLKLLAQLRRALATPEAALRLWQQIDLSKLQPLAEALPALVQRYAALAPGDPVPDPAAALKAAGIDLQDGDLPALSASAWDALYTAYATGADAGPKLEIPMAALRILHFAALPAAMPALLPLSAASALDALRAKPLIPAVMHEAGDADGNTPAALNRPAAAATAPGPVSPAAAPATSLPAVPPEATPAMQALLDQLSAAQSMLDAARNAPALLAPDVRQTLAPAGRSGTGGSGSGGGGGSGTTGAGGVQNISLSTIPKLQAALPHLTATQSNLLAAIGLDVATPIPIATRVLTDRITALTAQAMALRGDPVFHALVQTSAADNGALAGLSQLLGPMSSPLSSPSSGRAQRVNPPTSPLPPLPPPIPPAPPIGSSPDVDMRGRIRPLGIGDLKVVKQKLLAYLPGEVADIENVLKGESKSRVYRTLDRLETTLVETNETVQDSEHDNQSTDRFELKKEADATIKSDMSVKAGVTVTGSYGPVTMTAQGDFAYATSKDESTKNSANFGRDVVDRSVTKIQITTKTEQTTTTFHETEETDTHGVDNKDGAGNVTGVYRWVDKKYQAQIYNYGQRMMLEFVVPEPAAFYQASQMGQNQPVVDAVAPAPFLDGASYPLTPTAFTPSTYLLYTSRYNATGVTAPPQEWVYVSTAFEQNSIDNGHTLSKSVKDVVVPDGYQMMFYDAQVSVLWTNYPQFSLQIGDTRHYLLQDPGALHGQTFEVGTPAVPGGTQPQGVLPVSVVGYDINAYAVNVSALCSYLPATYTKWQQDMYDKCFTAYKAMKDEYDQKLQSAQAQAQEASIQIVGRNPGINLDIVARELKKHCLTMLTGMHFNDFHAMTDPADQPAHIPEIDPYTALTEGRFSEFFENAFEWEQITYLFYPYFWARKSRWIELFNLSDPDPAFMQFLQAGAARIVLPVSPAYDDAISYFLQSNKPAVADRIWQGGGLPTIDDPLYRSIADELRGQTDDLAGAVPEGDPWEFTVPTTLVWLQSDGTLPTFP